MMRSKDLGVLMLAALISTGGLMTVMAPAASAAGIVYYVSASGSDSNAGTSSTFPWKSLSKVNKTIFVPGDTISFRRGDTWTGGVVLNQSGTSTSNITLNGYGTGNQPSVTGGQAGNCFRINGSYVTLDGLRGTACGYAGFSIYGNYTVVRNSSASNNAVGLKSSTGSSFGTYTNNILTDNNIMNVNTPGTNCGTPQAVNCGDDSGAFGVLINGNDNDFSGNTVSGSNAFSYDFTRDGSAFEIYNGNRNKIHDNISLQNNAFSEIGRSTAGTADGNTYSYNLTRADCGANCAQAKGLIVRGAGSSFGPNNNTTFQHNTVWLNGPDSQAIVCHASCPASTVIAGNILAGVRNALWINGSGWTEQYNVMNGPVNVALNATSTTAAAKFVNAPSDLHLTGTSPAIDRAGVSPFTVDLDGVPVPQNGDCAGASASDSGTYEYVSPNCHLGRPVDIRHAKH